VYRSGELDWAEPPAVALLSERLFTIIDLRDESNAEHERAHLPAFVPGEGGLAWPADVHACGSHTCARAPRPQRAGATASHRRM
jgi:hypothetical protein